MLTITWAVISFILSLPGFISGAWALNSSEPILQYLSKHYSLQFATFSITWITTPLGLLMLCLIVYLLLSKKPKPQASSQRKLSASEIRDELASRIKTARDEILWLGAYKAGMYPVDQLREKIRHWMGETEAFLKQHVGQNHPEWFANALATGRKEYPGELRGMERKTDAYVIRKDMVDRFYTHVLILEEILKEVETEESKKGDESR